MTERAAYTIENREHLLTSLAEAAELEHALMCCYLYSMFTLKGSTSEGVSEKELAAIQRWRNIIRGVALEEMTHLTLVANLMSAVGGLPHFMRLNFPVPRGAFPADLVVSLAPFDLPAVEHFVYVERPHDSALTDGVGFQHETYRRESAGHRLMPFAGDYDTVGDLYATIRDAIERLCDTAGDAALFCGEPHLQVGPQDTPLPGVLRVLTRDDALKAIDTIVTQGEGASQAAGSHFERFQTIERDYRAVLADNPDFAPARPVARNPVMRRPPTPDGKVWVNHPEAVPWMDLSNATYALMLRALVQSYSQEDRDPECRRHLLDAATGLMRALTPIAEALTFLPASRDEVGVNAGMSFAMSRGLTPFETSTERAILLERLRDLERVFGELKAHAPADVSAAGAAFGRVRASLEALPRPGVTAPATTSAATHEDPTLTPPFDPDQEPGPADSPVEVARGKHLTVLFEAKRCIHARHCVTESPHVFLGGVEGEWIFPDRSETEDLLTTLRKCPSGALRYERNDGGAAEPPPRVNVLRVREDGPYAMLADVKLDGGPDGYRMVLCRCGRSHNKPFCDNSHREAGFRTTGEPTAGDLTPLEQRDGPLTVEPQRNGPLKVTGALEVCGTSGKPVARMTSALLCRCGGSRSKPFCDGTHAVNGFQARGAGS